MAKRNDRQGYVLYKSWNPALLSMTDAELGKVFRAIIQYQEGVPVTNAPSFFEIIRYTFQQDEERYFRKCDDNRLNRLIGNLKGLKQDVLQAQIEMIDLQDLKSIIDKAKDPDLKNTLILELHRRTQVTNVTHVTHVTDVTNKSKSKNRDKDKNIDIDKESESDKESDIEKGLDKELELDEGKEEGKGVQGEREKPHPHGDYQNVNLTDSEWGSLVREFGMDAVDDAIHEISIELHKDRKTAGYSAVHEYLQNK